MVNEYGRPVYVLGAGFSRAISEHMPLTDALGDAIRNQVGADNLPESINGSFEDWLTLLSTPLPFLEGYANTERRAIAERVTAAIAIELERCADLASRDAPPLWLSQLVALWHAERAVVLTFNYDTLVKRAVTTTEPIVDFDYDEAPLAVSGPQVVYPAPAAPVGAAENPATFLTSDSLQLLKLHGSLNWYWAQGDGSTYFLSPAAESAE
ncbi:hypothetical protein [Microbacterium sp. OR16]|uniref:hypothetical protein n=1 Tax=Microbacterium sp. OR16 TaxID=3095345 RepID=UPI0039B541CC